VSTFREEPDDRQFAAEVPEFMRHGWFLESPALTDEEICLNADEAFQRLDMEEAEAAAMNSYAS
jgi:hypothetical protein